ncbi:MULTISPECIES: hypothetical protein [Paenibacillus]|uniref:hypothetical protein n=1 Tax=Paenibacillus TaxID=44249 RepID=UPI00096CB826|nr:hypothetical protein [Paenibacillus odorifer]
MVQEMSDRDLNLALAELMDYPKNRFVPNYCTDPAASLEVQTKAIEVDHEGYLLNLMDAVYGGYVAASSDRIAGLLTASPRERAEAAYITLQGAKG